MLRSLAIMAHYDSNMYEKTGSIQVFIISEYGVGFPAPCVVAPPSTNSESVQINQKSPRSLCISVVCLDVLGLFTGDLVTIDIVYIHTKSLLR